MRALLGFEAEQVIKRVEKFGDLFEPTLKLKQKLPKFPAIQTSTSKVEAGLEISAQAEPRATNRKPAMKPAGKRKAPARKIARHNAIGSVNIWP